MCGLFGGLGNNLSKENIEEIKQLGIVSAMRGMDSTGLGIMYRKDGKKYRNQLFTTSVKDDTDSISFLYNKDTDRVIKELGNPVCLMGHTRFATTGGVSKENAHPFTKGKIVGAHNGVIKRYEWRAEKNRTDSEYLINMIDKEGIQKALEEGGSEGSYAVTYMDTHLNTFNFIRNRQRPLYYMLSKDERKLYWASEGIFLWLIKMRSNTDWDEPKQVDEHTLYSWNFNNNNFNCKKIPINCSSHFMSPTPSGPNTPFRAPFLQNLSDKKATGEVPFVPDQNGKTPMNGMIENDEAIITVHNKEVTRETLEFVHDIMPNQKTFCRRALINNIPKIIRYIDFNGFLISPEDAKKIFERGCCLSGSIPTLGEKIYWVDSKNFVLDIYRDDPHIMDHIRSRGRSVPRLGAPVYVSASYMIMLKKKREQEEEDLKKQYGNCNGTDLNEEDDSNEIVQCH